MRRRANSHEFDDSNDYGDESESLHALTPGQEKKGASGILDRGPRSLFSSVFNARNLQRVVGTLAEVGNSVANIVAPLDDDYEDDGQEQNPTTTKNEQGEKEEDIVASAPHNESDFSVDEIRYQRESKSRLAELAHGVERAPESPVSILDEIDLSMSLSPRSPVNPVNARGSFSPPPFSLSSALLAANPTANVVEVSLPPAPSQMDSNPGPEPELRAQSSLSPPIVSFIGNEELEKRVQSKYRESIEQGLSVLERRNRELSSELVSLEGRLTISDTEVAMLKDKLALALASSASHGLSAVDADSQAVLQKEIAALRTENSALRAREGELVHKVDCLEKSLTSSEESLKGAEEIAWQAKAEAAEVIFALRLEQEKNAKSAARASEMEKELSSMKEGAAELEKGKVQTSQVCAVDSEEVTAPLSDKAKSPVLGDGTNTHDEALLEEVHSLKVVNANLLEEVAKFTEQLESMRISEKKHVEASKLADVTKATLVKTEKECQQLQVVIKQLQQKQKGSRDDFGAVLAERDTLRQQVDDLQEQVKEMAHLSSQANKLETVTAELETLQKLNSRLENGLEEAKRRVGELEKINYDLTEAQQGAKSDALLLQQEIDQRILETGNLRDALQQVKRERAAWTSRNQDETERKLDALRKEHSLNLLEVEETWRVKLAEQEEAIKVSQQRWQDESLLRRKAEIELNTEKRKLKKTLDDTLSQLRNSQEDVVDRTLIANLVVAYFSRGRPLDGLDLISRVLGFTEEQQQIVGLRVPNINLIGTLYTTIVGAQPKPVSNLEGDNLLEMWANFLEMEAQEAQSKVSGGGRSGSSSSISTSQTPAPALPTLLLPPPMPIGNIRQQIKIEENPAA